ncbi:MAG TPA: hypothetical protein VEJ86_06990 [Candidatus Binataceae bacterium]|nr:hypothetical protein [Candidatus Binataceae bacterium]
MRLRLRAQVLTALVVVTLGVTALRTVAYAGVPWLNGEYLYRYFAWGGRHLRDLSKDYEMFPLPRRA